MAEEQLERKIVIPGEVIVEGEDFLPGENTEKIENKIISRRFGLAEISENLVKIIPLSGVYSPRRGNVVIGSIENISFNGWFVDIGAQDAAFLPITEVPKYINKNHLEEVMDIGDIIIAKIIGITKRGVDLTIRARNLGKLREGLIIKINPNKVPRVIGKEGSMIKLIKSETGCNITVGQNGMIWIKGEKIENELLGKDAIMFICDRPFINGLTDKITEWFKERKEND